MPLKLALSKSEEKSTQLIICIDRTCERLAAFEMSSNNKSWAAMSACVLTTLYLSALILENEVKPDEVFSIRINPEKAYIEPVLIEFCKKHGVKIIKGKD